MSLAVMLKTCYDYSGKKDKQTISISELTFWGFFCAKNKVLPTPAYAGVNPQPHYYQVLNGVPRC